MFRVPLDAEAPTFDHTERIGLARWLTSRRAERVEWKRRRDLASAAAAALRAQRAGEVSARRLAAQRAAADVRYQAESEGARARQRYDQSGPWSS